MTKTTHISLEEALIQDDEKQFHYILDTEGLPRGINWFDYDLLTKALRHKSKRIIAYLLERRCRILKTDDTTVLDKIVNKLGKHSIIERLLTLKSQVADVNDKGDTVLHSAFSNNFPEYIIDLLLRHYMHETTVNVKNRDGLSFLHIACTRPNEILVQEFLESGKADVNCQVSLLSESIYSGYTTLHFAVENGRHKVVKCLLKFNADIYAQDRYGSTPLHLALERNDKEMIDLLCYHDNRNENYINNFGLSHFMAACASSDPMIPEQYLYMAEQDPLSSVRILINGRVKNINEYPYGCYTPLHFAAEFGRLETVKFLLNQGANCCATTSKKLTPCDLATSNEHLQICNLLLQHSCKCRAEVVEKTDETAPNAEVVNNRTLERSATKENSQEIERAEIEPTAKKGMSLTFAFSCGRLHVVFAVLIGIFVLFMIDFSRAK